MPARTIRDLLTALRGVAVTPRTATVVVLGLTDTVILKNNPSRIAWLIVNFGLIDAFIQPLTVPVGGSGIRVAANGGAVTAQFDEDGEVVAYEWHSVSVINTVTTLTVIEELIEPRDRAETA